MTNAYCFKKHFSELTNYFVNVITAARIECKSKKVRKVIRKGFKRYVQLEEKIDFILVCGEEG